MDAVGSGDRAEGDEMYGDGQGNPGPGMQPAGWYPDPVLAGTMRYWDGSGWSEHTASGYDHPAPGAAARQPYAAMASARPTQSFGHANRQSLIAMGVALAYVAIAQLVGIVFLGIIPVMAAWQALQRKEQLAPLALVAAIGSIVLSFTALTR